MNTVTRSLDSNAKVWFAGTHRAKDPQLTLANVYAVAPIVGITRIADVTGLDDIGIPVAIAIRPLARTLTVSAGKGLSRVLAKVSAGMESIELWHAEHCSLPRLDASASEISPDYPVDQLPMPHFNVWTDDLRLSWTPAIRMLDGAQTVVPEECVSLSSVVTDPVWSLPIFLRTSNGLASGNTVAEAALHALLELVERDALAEYRASGRAERVPLPSGIDSVDGLHEAFVSSGNKIELLRLHNRFGLPCFHAVLRGAAVPLTFTGAGCHTSAEVAACRALTEAAQNRLGVIAGSRDDLDPRIYEWQRDVDRPAFSAQAVGDQFPLGASLADQVQCETPSQSIEEDLAVVAKAVTRVVGVEPMYVDLTHPDIGVPVVRVIAPGLRFDARTVFGRSSSAVGAR